MNATPPRTAAGVRRRPTREVKIGDIGVGGRHPLRLQSMTTTDPQDVAATAAQIERLTAAGCEIARVTVPSIRDAEVLPELRAALTRRGVAIPLVADVHFAPRAALAAVEAVEKVRVNPGNFADKKRFEVREYSDAEYAAELERVADRFRPLVRRCKALGRALRIGTNHGSLSDRIMNRFGDTPEGMVQSALEFLDVCEQESFRDVVFSMKASNPQVAIYAYRLLAQRLSEREPDAPSYPLHIGVTEAGDGEDGRVKSAIGIGALLLDGLGDTIRVSLTEDPVRELPVARALADRAERAWARAAASPTPAPDTDSAPQPPRPQAYSRRRTTPVATRGAVPIGGAHPVRVELTLGPVPPDGEAFAQRLGATLGEGEGSELSCEGLRCSVVTREDIERARCFATALGNGPNGGPPLAVELPPDLAAATECAGTELGARWIVPLGPGERAESIEAIAGRAAAAGIALEWELRAAELPEAATLGSALRASKPGHALLSVGGEPLVPAVRQIAARCAAEALSPPLLLRWDGAAEGGGALAAAAELGSLLCDGLGDALALPIGAEPRRALEHAYRILQGARLRTSWTEFISCPSCGRTLFDLEETTARIRAKTNHLKGVKIAIMGCIVNGPGEMADADFGYVGSGPGLVNLYVGHDCVERHVPSAEADERLVDLLRKHGRWVDPPAAARPA